MTLVAESGCSPARGYAGPRMDRILDALEGAGWLAARDTKQRSKLVKISGRTVRLYHVRIEAPA